MQNADGYHVVAADQRSATLVQTEEVPQAVNAVLGSTACDLVHMGRGGGDTGGLRLRDRSLRIWVAEVNSRGLTAKSTVTHHSPLDDGAGHAAP